MINNQIRIGDLFKVQRGIATGANNFFVMSAEEASERKIPDSFLKPCVTSPKQLEQEIIESDRNGVPKIKSPLFLLDSPLSNDEIETKFPAVWAYLNKGLESGVSDGYLCRKRERWYQQEKRPPAKFLLSYMGRATSRRPSPFRFFLNQSQAIATNGFLCLYPKNRLATLLREDPAREFELLSALNSINAETLKDGGRSYGGGLKKVEPNELMNLPLPNLPDWLSICVQLKLL